MAENSISMKTPKHLCLSENGMPVVCKSTDAANIFNTVSLSEAESKNLSVIKTKFDAYFAPKMNIMYERYLFNKITQAGQPFDNFLTSVVNQGKKCEFGELYDSFLREKIVVGVCSGTVRVKLLAEEDLSFDKTVKICRASEMTKLQVSAMRGDTLPSWLQPSTENVSCICQSKQVLTVNSGQQGRTPEPSSSETFFVSSIDINHKKLDWIEKLTLPNGNSVSFKLDTGAQCNVLSSLIAQRALITIRPSKTKVLVSFSNDSVAVWVKWMVSCITDLIDQPNFHIYPPRRVPYSIRDKVKEELNDIIELITEPTPAVSATVVVHKNGKVRICIDPSDINKNLKRRHYPLQTMEEIAANLKGSKYFTLIKTQKRQAFEQLKKKTISITELKRFLGMINYLSKFIPRVAERPTLLRKLLEKDVTWHWELEQENAFEDLKDSLKSQPLLRFFDHTKQALTKTQQNYSQIEKEAFAILSACKKFHEYIWGNQEVTIETEHKPLEVIFKKPLHDSPIRLHRIQHIEHDCHNIAEPDARAVYEVQVVIPMSAQRIAQLKDAIHTSTELPALCQFILHGWPDTIQQVADNLRKYWTFGYELVLYKDIIFKGKRTLIPPSWKPLSCHICTALTKGHDTGHNQLCAKMCHLPENTKRPHVGIPQRGDYPFEAMDFAQHVIPDELRTDGGPQYASHQFQKFREEWNFQHRISSPHFPRLNGLAEQYIQEAKKSPCEVVNRNRHKPAPLHATQEVLLLERHKQWVPAEVAQAAPNSRSHIIDSPRGRYRRNLWFLKPLKCERPQPVQNKDPRQGATISPPRIPQEGSLPEKSVTPVHISRTREQGTMVTTREAPLQTFEGSVMTRNIGPPPGTPTNTKWLMSQGRCKVGGV
ncbi:hypothetical protein PR048_016897 [Dryococelus australis]|uniref:Integrase catalytic domain-containing protein n=1 Tax=Dryococelus australis TaxID=614101 RepID=A0ABQ9H7Z1_9NEOP|nr:hypothetical protein PR048_016897 [Dryococelus australis]